MSAFTTAFTLLKEGNIEVGDCEWCGNWRPVAEMSFPYMAEPTDKSVGRGWTEKPYGYVSPTKKTCQECWKKEMAWRKETLTAAENRDFSDIRPWRMATSQFPWSHREPDSDPDMVGKVMGRYLVNPEVGRDIRTVVWDCPHCKQRNSHAGSGHSMQSQFRYSGEANLMCENPQCGRASMVVEP